MIGLIGDEPTPGRVAVVVGAVVLFLGLFIHAIRGRTAPKPPAVIARAFAVDLAIASALTVADRPDWSLLFYYVVALGGTRFPRPWNVISVVGTAAVAAGTTLIGGGNQSATGGLALGLLGIGAAMVVLGDMMRTNRELLEARAEVARLAVADERVRFARDLHDLLGHSLSVIALKSELAGRLLPGRPDAAAEQVADIERVSRRALSEVREAVGGYRRPTLAAEVDSARDALRAAGIAVDVVTPSVALPADAEAILAWAVREGATNALRHAQAGRVGITVDAGLDEARIEVVDDGRGADGPLDGGTGLVGLAERVARAHGRIEAAGLPGGGFRLAVAVPLEAAP